MKHSKYTYNQKSCRCASFKQNQRRGIHNINCDRSFCINCFLTGRNKYFDEEHIFWINMLPLEPYNALLEKKRAYSVQKRPRTRNIFQHLWGYLQEWKKKKHTNTQSLVIIQSIHRHLLQSKLSNKYILYSYYTLYSHINITLHRIFENSWRKQNKKHYLLINLFRQKYRLSHFQLVI